jgi:hypothetical protein
MSEVVLHHVDPVQLGLDMDVPTVAPPYSPSTPMAGFRQNKQPNRQGNWYDVACSAGRFIVKSTHELWVGETLLRGLESKVTRVSHPDEASEPKSLRELLQLEEINTDELTIGLVTQALASHYDSINHPNVVYIGQNAPQE